MSDSGKRRRSCDNCVLRVATLFEWVFVSVRVRLYVTEMPSVVVFYMNVFSSWYVECVCAVRAVERFW